MSRESRLRCFKSTSPKRIDGNIEQRLILILSMHLERLLAEPAPTEIGFVIGAAA